MHAIKEILIRELKRLFSDRRQGIILLFGPLCYTLLLGYLYVNHTVNAIPLVVLDQDQTQLSRSLVQAFADSDRFAYQGLVEDEAELQQLIAADRIQAGVILPPDFTDRVKTGQGAEVLVVANGSNFIIGNAVMGSSLDIVQTISAGTSIQQLEARGSLPEMARATAVPISYRFRPLYNPTYNYINFLLLGLISTISQQLTLLFVAISIVRERERGTVPELAAFGYSSGQILTGKLLPYYLINVVSLGLMLAVAYQIFDIPMRGSLLPILALGGLFMLVVTFLGIFLSTVCRTEVEATQLAMLFAIPSFLFCGYTWPYMAMPPFCQLISSILPLTYFALPLRQISIMGAGWEVVAGNFQALGIMTAILLPASYLVFSRKWKKWQSEVAR